MEIAPKILYNSHMKSTHWRMELNVLVLFSERKRRTYCVLNRALESPNAKIDINEMKNDTNGEERRRRWVCATLKPDIRKYMCSECHFGICIYSQTMQTKIDSAQWAEKKRKKKCWEREMEADHLYSFGIVFTVHIYCFDPFRPFLFFMLFLFLLLEGFFVCVCTSTFVNSILCFAIRIRTHTQQLSLKWSDMKGSTYTHSSTQVQKPKRSSSSSRHTTTTTTIIIISSQKIYMCIKLRVPSHSNLFI